MLQLQQSATCPVCFEGAQTLTDEYEDNWNEWHAHLLELEAHTEAWSSWQHKEPIVTHAVVGSNKPHWLCRACVYKHNRENGNFSIENCPICRVVINIPSRNAENLANLAAYAYDSASDEESVVASSSSDEEEQDFDIAVHICGYDVTTLSDLSMDCMLTKEVSIQNSARAAGQDITNVAAMMVFTRNALYTPCGDQRRNWGVQFLVHAIDILQDLNILHREELGALYIRPSYIVPISPFEHAVEAGKHILALRPFFEDGRYVSPLYDFSPDGRYAVQMQGFRTELRDIVEDEDSEARKHDIYAHVSVFFLQTILPDFFAADPEASSVYNNGRLLEINTQYNRVPPALSKRDYVVQVLVAIDTVLQQYNQSVYHAHVTNNMFHTPQGIVQTILAPRPWVMMQIIHIDDQYKIVSAPVSVLRRLWADGIRIVYADLALSRRPSMEVQTFFERVASFRDYVASRNYHVYNIPALTSVHMTAVMLVQTAGMELHRYLVPGGLSPQASITGPRNALIFEAMQHIDNTN